MSTNKQSLVPNAREALNKFKMEAANEVGVNLKQGFLLRLFQQRQVGRSRNLPSLHRFLGAGDRRYGRLYPGVRGA